MGETASFGRMSVTVGSDVDEQKTRLINGFAFTECTMWTAPPRLGLPTSLGSGAGKLVSVPRWAR